ncbi:MAG: hypothetical protein OHK0013_15920 [Sandaracinaceae bacterium]
MHSLDEFYGLRDKLDELAEVPCKANWLGARRRYVEEQYGRRGLDDVAARLPDEALRRSFLEPPLPMSWARVGTVVAIDHAIFEGPMGGSLGRMRHFGGEIAKYDVPSLYRAFIRLGTPSFVLSKIGLVWSMYFRKGALTTELRDGSADIHLRGLVLPAYLCQHGISGWLDATLELVEARAPVVRHGRCVHAGDDHCVWTASWRT